MRIAIVGVGTIGSVIHSRSLQGFAVKPYRDRHRDEHEQCDRPYVGKNFGEAVVPEQHAPHDAHGVASRQRFTN
jgi:lactate dehydrogenase-like 2-hydroxyacid dehydrogenase